MIFSSFLLTFTFIVALCWLIGHFIARTKQLPGPPGPYGVPLLGYLPFLRKEPHHILTKMGKKYGSVFSLTMGKHKSIVLHDWKAVKAALIDQGDIFAGRPVLDVSAAISGGLFGIILNHGLPWKEQRRFAHQQLRDLGLGRSMMEAAVEVELDNAINILDNEGKHGVDMKTFLFIPIMNVIWSITAGKRFENGDAEMEYFRKLICEMMYLTGVQADILYMPDIVLKLGYKKAIIERRTMLGRELLNLMQKEIDKHKERPEDKSHDFIAKYLAEMERQKTLPLDQRKTSFHETQLQHVTMNFFVAGVETTANTLAWASIYLCLWPEVQKKVQKELDDAFGTTRKAAWSDRAMLPYCNATILEIQRYTSVLPFSVLHRTNASTTLLGYHIPKDALVIPNLYSISYSEELWGDPRNFRPERFLDERGNVVIPDYFLPFSAGPRICLGAPIAKLELFLFFTHMFHQFSFRLPDGVPKPSLDGKFGVSLAPPDADIIIERRIPK